MEVRHEYVPRRMLKRLGIAAVDASPAAMHGLIPSSRRDYESFVAAADTAQQVGLVHQMLGNDMNDAIRGLHPAAASEHLRAQYHRPTT